MKHHKLRLGILCGVMLAWEASAASGRRTPQETRAVRYEVTVDVSELSANLAASLVVRNGESFASIARSRYGDEAAREAIAILNPGVDPRKLKPGTVLLVPPARAEPTDSRPRSTTRRARPAAQKMLVLLDISRTGRVRGFVPVTGTLLTDSSGSSRPVDPGAHYSGMFALIPPAELSQLNAAIRTGSDANATASIERIFGLIDGIEGIEHPPRPAAPEPRGGVMTIRLRFVLRDGRPRIWEKVIEDHLDADGKIVLRR